MRIQNQEAAESGKGPGMSLDSAMAELEGLVGLTQVKKLIREIKAFVEIQAKRKRHGLLTEPMVLHMVFKGNPGTGKTTVARILGNILREMEVLSRGHLVEVERADLVGEYIGQTAQKTREQVKRAMGGILFIDEAYSLARGGEKDFGREAIDTLVKSMEDHKDDILLILAGYLQEMERFMRMNPGLRSRFPIQLLFPDYSAQELMEIAVGMVRKRQYQLSPEARELIADFTRDMERVPPASHGNARDIRNLIERAIRKQAVRLVGMRRNLSRRELMIIEAADIEEALKGEEGSSDWEDKRW